MKRSHYNFLGVATVRLIIVPMLSAGMLLTEYTPTDGFAQEAPAHAVVCTVDTGVPNRAADGHPAKAQTNVLRTSPNARTSTGFADGAQYSKRSSFRTPSSGWTAPVGASAHAIAVPAPMVPVVPEVAISHNTSSVAPYLKTLQSTTNGGALVHLLTPQTVTISKTSDLFFGTIVIGSKPGTVTVPPNGAAHAEGAVILSPSGDQSAAQFEVTFHDIDDSRHRGRSLSSAVQKPSTDEAFEPLSVLLPDHILLTRAGDKEAMRVDEFCSATDHNDIRIGATLHVNPNQPRGLYSGTYCITIVRE